MKMIKPIILVAVMSTLPGCSGYWLERDFDREVRDLLRSQEDMSLGEGHGIASQIPMDHIASDASSRAKMESLKPGTNNPGADQLPAKTDEGLLSGQKARDEIPQFLKGEKGEQLYDLKQVLSYAVKNAPDYRNEKEAVYLETISLLSERHLWGPRFFNTVSSTVNGTPEAGDHSQALTLINELGVTQRLPNGGSVSASALVTFVENLRDASSKASNSQSASLVVSANLPLLRGSGSIARESLIQAERDLIYGVRDFERFRREFMVRVATDYFNLLFQQKRIKNNGAQVDRLKRLMAQNKALVDAGNLKPFELQRNEQELFNAQIRLLRSEESYITQVESFKILIGMPEGEVLTVVPTELVIPEPELDSSKAVTAAFLYRLDLQNQKDRLDDTRRAVRIAKDELRGDLNLTASATLPTHGDRTRAGVDLQPGEGSYSAGLTFNMALDRYVEKANHRRAVVNLERGLRSYRVQKSRVANDVRGTIREIKLARLSLELQKKSVLLAQKRVEEVNLNRGGRIGKREQIEAAQSLLEAEDARDESDKDLRVRVLQYLLVTGQLRVDSKGQWRAPVNLVAEQVEKK